MLFGCFHLSHNGNVVRSGITPSNIFLSWEKLNLNLNKKDWAHVPGNSFYCGMCFEKVKNISITIPGSDPRGPPDRPAARHWLRWAAECCLLSSQVLFSLSTPLMMGRLATGVIPNTCYLSYYLHIYTRSPHMYRSKRIHSIDIIYLYSRYICAECLLTENRYVDMYFGPWIR